MTLRLGWAKVRDLQLQRLYALLIHADFAVAAPGPAGRARHGSSGPIAFRGGAARARRGSCDAAGFRRDRPQPVGRSDARHGPAGPRRSGAGGAAPAPARPLRGRHRVPRTVPRGRPPARERTRGGATTGRGRPADRPAASRVPEDQRNGPARRAQGRGRELVGPVPGRGQGPLQFRPARAAERPGLCPGNRHPSGAGPGEAPAPRSLARGAAGPRPGSADHADARRHAGQ